MNVLFRKLQRDLLRSGWQYAAVAVMVILGVAFFNASYACYVNLTRSYETSYRLLNFEDFGIAFQAAPDRVAKRIARIRGVKAAEGRLVEDVAVELPGRRTKKLVGRLITVPPDRDPRVNGLKIVAGRGLQESSGRSILIEASFAEHHRLQPGDWVVATKGSSEVRLRIAGIVQSAEYLYVVRSKQDLIAFPDTFGVMFVSQDVLGPLVGRRDQINEVRVTLWNPAALHGVMREAKALLSAYRPQDPVPRADQPSYQMLEQDVRGFQAYAVMFPLLFLSVAAAAVYTLLMRVVHQQRPAIGLIRSLGYPRRTVVLHYLGAALLVGLIGGVMGSAVGIWLAGLVSRAYMAELQVPFEEIVPRWDILGSGVVIGMASCVLAAVVPARQAASIRPAEAMRPSTPSFGSRSIRLDWLIPGAKLAWKVPLRNIFRQPKRTISTVFGIVAGMTLMILAKGLMDSSEVAIGDLMSGAYRSDLQVGFMQTQSHSIVQRVSSWPGVIRAEGQFEVPVEFKKGSKTYAGLLSGQDPASRLQDLKDASGRPLRPTAEGAVFGPTLRKKLGLEVGDIVAATLPAFMGKETPAVRLIRVGAFNEESIGTVAYLPRSEVYKRFKRDLELPPNPITGVALQVRPDHIASVRERLLKLPGAGSVTSMPEIRKMIKDMLKTAQRFVWIMELFGVALAIAMIFNMVSINVLERESEIGTLRTIGMGRLQIAGMVVAENMAVTLMGVLAGMPIGRLFVQFFWQAAQTEEQQELITFNIYVLPETYAMAALAVIFGALLSQIPALLRVQSLDLTKAAKEHSS